MQRGHERRHSLLKAARWERLPCALPSLVALGFLLSACSNPFSQKANFLNRVVRPLMLPRKSLSEEWLAGRALQVNGTYYFLLGRRLSSLGKGDLAIAALERARRFDEHSATVHQALAEEYLRKGMTEEGVAMVRKAVELEPENRSSLLLLAGLQATAKKYLEATEILTKLASRDPDDEEVILNLALLELEQKKYGASLARLQRFLVTNPESAVAQFYVGRLEQEQGHPQKALDAYQKAVDLRSGFVQAGTYLGFLQEETGRRKAAIDTFAWLAAQTDSSRYHKKHGQLLLEENQYARSLEAFLNYSRLEPSDLNNRVKIGLLYLELKNLPMAERQFRDVLREAPESENVRFYLAAALEERQAFTDALREYEKIPEGSKLAPEALKRRSWIVRRTQSPIKAVELVSRILEQEKSGASRERTEELYEILSAVAEGSVPDMIQQSLSAALLQHPQSERLHYVQAVLLEKAGASTEAVSSMEKVLQLNPDHPGALNFIAFIWAEKNLRLVEAERLALRALRLRPKDPFITDSLGWIYYRQARYQEALKVLQEAMNAAPHESVIADHLGDVLVKLGRLAEAKSHYEKALSLGPDKESERRSLESKLAKVSGTLEAHQSCPHGVCDPRGPATTHPH